MLKMYAFYSTGENVVQVNFNRNLRKLIYIFNRNIFLIKYRSKFWTNAKIGKMTFG